MIAALARFVDALRAEGHPVSPPEVIDASRALDLVGLERRSEVRSALRATLAKDRRAAAAFDRLFDRFFAAPRREGRGEGAGRPLGAGERRRPSETERHGPARKPEDRRSRRKDAAREDARNEERRAGAPREGRLRRARLRPETGRAPVPRHRDLARRMTTDEERALAREVPRLVREIALRRSRRLERARSGRPWIRRMMRESLGSGGVPFVLPHRRPRRKTARVILLVDVSFSVARAAGLFLLMAAEFLELGRGCRVVAFVDKPVDATSAIARWARGRMPAPAPARTRRGPRPGEGIARRGIAFTDVLDRLADLNLDAPSDYGRVFHALYASRLRPRGRDAVLVVLGDGRTNRFDPLPWALSEIARGCRAALWLVSEPASRWGTADSALPAYLPEVDVVAEAHDLEGLAAGLSELLRRL
jgi:uncharacterized protein with von Willebrand factor type A (vWA) domain